MALLPLAPIANVPKKDVPAVLAKIDRRVSTEADGKTSNRLRAAIDHLLQLRYDMQMIEEMIREADEAGEQNFFTMVRDGLKAKLLREGRREGEALGQQKLLLRQGEVRFGSPPPEITLQIESIADPNRLIALSIKLLEVSSWEELLADTGIPATRSE